MVQLINASMRMGALLCQGPRVPCSPKIIEAKEANSSSWLTRKPGRNLSYFSPKIALHMALSQRPGAMVTKPSNASLDRTDRGKPETLANSIYPPGDSLALATKPIKMTISCNVGVSLLE